jgi:hypothetical protein
MSDVSPAVKATVDAIELGLNPAKLFTAREVALISTTVGLVTAAEWLFGTLDDTPDSRYAQYLVLTKQAQALGMPGGF